MTQAAAPGLSALRHDYPRWRIWSSDAGHLYATRPGMSAHPPGEAVTVDAKTPAGLREAITGAECDHARMIRHQDAHR